MAAGDNQDLTLGSVKTKLIARLRDLEQEGNTHDRYKKCGFTTVTVKCGADEVQVAGKGNEALLYTKTLNMQLTDESMPGSEPCVERHPSCASVQGARPSRAQHRMSAMRTTRMRTTCAALVARLHGVFCVVVGALHCLLSRVYPMLHAGTRTRSPTATSRLESCAMQRRRRYPPPTARRSC